MLGQREHVRMIFKTSHLWWCQWSMDCRTATRQASVAPAAEERGPEGTAAGSAAPSAASSQHPEHRLPDPAAWTHSAAAPAEETRFTSKCHSTSEGLTMWAAIKDFQE